MPTERQPGQERSQEKSQRDTGYRRKRASCCGAVQRVPKGTDSVVRERDANGHWDLLDQNERVISDEYSLPRLV